MRVSQRGDLQNNFKPQSNPQVEAMLSLLPLADKLDEILPEHDFIPVGLLGKCHVDIAMPIIIIHIPPAVACQSAATWSGNTKGNAGIGRNPRKFQRGIRDHASQASHVRAFYFEIYIRVFVGIMIIPGKMDLNGP